MSLPASVAIGGMDHLEEWGRREKRNYMGVIRRGKRSYRYVSIRVDGSVQTHYLGPEVDPQTAAWSGRWGEVLRRRREDKLAVRAEKARLLAEEGTVAGLTLEARVLASVAMASAGYHRLNGTWRRRRKESRMADEEIESGPLAERPSAFDGEVEARLRMEDEWAANLKAVLESAREGGRKGRVAAGKYFDWIDKALTLSTDGPALLSAILTTHRGDPPSALEDELIRRYAGEDLLCREATRRRLEIFRAELRGDGPVTAIEAVLIERAALTWLAAYVAETTALRLMTSAHQTPAFLDYLGKNAERAGRRLLAVLKDLDLVRRRALPAIAKNRIQVNMMVDRIGIQVNQPGLAEPPRPAISGEGQVVKPVEGADVMILPLSPLPRAAAN